MKWIYTLPCLVGFLIITDLKASVVEQPPLDEGNKIKEIGKSYMRHQEVLQAAESEALVSALDHAIEQRVHKLKQREKEPLSPLKLVRYEELYARRLHLKTEGKDLFNEQLSELEHLEEKRAESNKVQGNLDLFEELQRLDKRFESLKKIGKPSIEQSVDLDNEQFLSKFEAARKDYLLRFSLKGRPLFHFLTSLGIAKGYFTKDAWKDETYILHTATELIRKKTTHALDVIPMNIDAGDLHAHLMAVMEGMLESNPQFLRAITRYVAVFDREMIIGIGLSRRPDLEATYILEEGTEEWSTRHLLFALGVLPQMIHPLGGYVGSSANLEKEIRSRREALLVMKMIEVENIQQHHIQVPLVPLPDMVNGQFEEDDHSASSEDDAVGSDEDDDSSSSSDEENHDHHTREEEQRGAIESSDEESEDAPALIDDGHLLQNNRADNQQQEIDPDALIEELSSGFHLRSFLKVKAQEIHIQALEGYLESARSAKMSKLSSSKSWRNKFWKQAIHKGLFNIAQINPLIQAFEDQTILNGD